MQPTEQPEPLRGDFLIRQNIFHREELGLGQKKRVGKPVEKCFVEQFLPAHVGTDYPKRGLKRARERRHEKGLRRRDDMGERDRSLSRAQGAQPLRHGRAAHDRAEQLRA